MNEASINSELNRLQHSMYLSNVDLQAKQEYVERLNRTLNSLDGKLGDFQSNEQLCRKPECCKQTLHGNNADDVENLRDGDLIPSYQEIVNTQLKEKKNQIQTKISELEGDISSLSSSINSMESRKEYLIGERKKVRSQT